MINELFSNRKLIVALISKFPAMEDIKYSQPLTRNDLGSVWLLSKIFGLFPTVGDRSQKTNASKSNNSIFLDFLYTFVWLAVYLISFGFAVFGNPMSSSSTRHRFPMICVIGNLIHIYVALFASMTSYILSPRKGKVIFGVLFKIKGIDKDLNEFSTKESTDFSKDSFRFQNIFVGLGVTIFCVITVYDFWIFREMYGYYSTIICFSYIFPHFISTLVILQFTSIINIVLIRLKFVNSCLTELLSREDATLKAEDSKIATLHLATMKPIIFLVDKSKSLQNNFTSRPKLSNNKDNTRAIHLNLDKLFDLHDQLVGLSEISNESYSIQLVTFITGAFINILFGLFFELKVLFWVWSQKTQMLLYASSYLYWSVMNACLIYALLSICTSARNEACESALIAHKILQQKPYFMIGDDSYYHKIKSFTLQILHRKNTFQFNGLGLFSLDYSFIFSTVSAATSYLIVLLQFDMSAADM